MQKLLNWLSIKNVGLRAVTDGEFRRTFWHLDFLAALDGVKEVDAENSQCNLNTIMSAQNIKNCG